MEDLKLLDELTTEKRNSKTLHIDQVTTLEIVRLMNSEDKKVPTAIEKELPKIAKAIDLIAEKIEKGGRLVYIGAGTSGRLGILDATECPPTYGVSKEMVQGIIAGGYDAVFSSKEGAEDSKKSAINDLNAIKFSDKDVLVGIAASGRTPYVIGALEYANQFKALTIAISCNYNSEISKISKIAIEAVVGPEVVTGSTRLKAGTAQKLILNMISTGVMIKLGKVYENLMVDVRSSNQKLEYRAKHIVCEATGVSVSDAEKFLKTTEFDVKLAIFMILSGLKKDEAKEKLEENKGYIAKALSRI